MAASSCRQRKCRCDECGYTIRVTRSWLEIGLPSCPCGGELAPTEPCDLAFIGRISEMDVSARDWTVICRENGWDGQIIRRGAAAKAWALKDRPVIVAAKPTCAFTGCGRWVAAGEDRCREHSHVPALPF